MNIAISFLTKRNNITFQCIVFCRSSDRGQEVRTSITSLVVARWSRTVDRTVHPQMQQTCMSRTEYPLNAHNRAVLDGGKPDNIQVATPNHLQCSHLISQYGCILMIFSAAQPLQSFCNALYLDKHAGCSQTRRPAGRPAALGYGGVVHCSPSQISHPAVLSYLR